LYARSHEHHAEADRRAIPRKHHRQPGYAFHRLRPYPPEQQRHRSEDRHQQRDHDHESWVRDAAWLPPKILRRRNHWHHIWRASAPASGRTRRERPVRFDARIDGKVYMTQRLAIRVSLAKDGKTPVRELMVDGLKVTDISYVELIEFIMQATSSLRYEVIR